MRLKLNENITVDARTLLAAFGHDVDTVADEQLVGRPDPDVLAAAVSDRPYPLAENNPSGSRPWLTVQTFHATYCLHEPWP